VAYPDLEISGEGVGGGGARSSRPLDKEGGWSPKKQFGLKIRGGRAPLAPPLDPPLTFNRSFI